MKPILAEYEVLTPTGRGAVGVVSVRGSGAVEAVGRLFRPSSPIALGGLPAGRIRLGRIGRGEGDEVVLVVRPGQDPIVEVHGHGGRAAQAMIVEALESVGIRPRRKARPSPSRDALHLLPSAASLKAAEVLIGQASGLFEWELGRLADLIETDWPGAAEGLDRLIARGQCLGLRLVDGWTVTLAGPPNAGKSRLLNAIAGYERAIVADRPGTTRDVVQLATACLGWPVRFEDTAGLGATDDPLEQAGQDRARSSQRRADLVVVVIDGSRPLGEAERTVLAEYPDGFRVASKGDLPACWSAEDLDARRVSGLTGEGVEPLLAAIAGRLVPEPPAVDEPLPTLPEHLNRLRRARGWLRAGRRDRAQRLLRAWADRSRGASPLRSLP